MKNSDAVGKTSSSRDSQPDDLDTVLVVSSEEIAKARKEAESLTSETATIDCHPVILDDSEEDTDRFKKDQSSSGLVPKNPPASRPLKKPQPEKDLETATEVATSKARPPATMVDVEEEIELSLSGVEPDIEETPTGEAIGKMVASLAEESKAQAKQERATITEVGDVDPVTTVRRGLDDETATEERPKIKKLPRFDDETKPMPKPDLGLVAGALETVPLDAAMVKNVIAQVDARAAARNAGQAVPPFHPQGPSPLNPHIAGARVSHAPAQPPRHFAQQMAPPHLAPPAVAAPPRRGVEVLITLIAFFAVAVPALYFLYVAILAQP